MNPTQAFANRTARLVAEGAHKDRLAFRSEAVTVTDKLRMAEEFTGPEWCHVCSRATDHYGEHSDAQLLKFYNSPLGRRLMS
jgi:beta-galactosidase GanA